MDLIHSRKLCNDGVSSSEALPNYAYHAWPFVIETKEGSSCPIYSTTNYYYHHRHKCEAHAKTVCHCKVHCSSPKAPTTVHWLSKQRIVSRNTEEDIIVPIQVDVFKDQKVVLPFPPDYEDAEPSGDVARFGPQTAFRGALKVFLIALLNALISHDVNKLLHLTATFHRWYRWSKEGQTSL